MKKANIRISRTLLLLFMVFSFMRCEQEPPMSLPEMSGSIFKTALWISHNQELDEVELRDSKEIIISVPYENGNLSGLISKAIEIFDNNGGVILIGQGKFRIDEPINLVSGLEFKGVGNSTIIRSATNTFFKGNSVNDVVLSNIKLIGIVDKSGSTHNAVELTGNSTNNMIREMSIDSINGSGIILSGTGCTNNTIQDNVINFVTGSAIILDEGASGKIEGNEIESTGDHAILLNGGSDASIINNSIVDAGGQGEFGNMSTGIKILSASKVTVSKNAVNTTTNGGIVASNSSYVRILENVISSSSSDGILAETLDSAVIARNNLFVVEGNGIKATGTSADKTTKILIQENKISYIQGTAAIFLEYLSEGSVKNNVFVPGTNPLTVALFQGDEITGLIEEANEVDNSSIVPMPVCRYLFDTTGASKYGTAPPRIADFSSGVANFDNGKQWLFDAGEGFLPTFEQCMNAKHNLSYERINGKYRWVMESDPGPSSDLGLDPNNSTVRSWLSPGAYHLAGTGAKTIAFWVRISANSPTRATGYGSSVVCVGVPIWDANSPKQGINIVLVKNDGFKNFKVAFNKTLEFTVPTPIKDDTWYHLVVRVPASGSVKDVQVLLNGTLVSTHHNDPQYNVPVNITDEMFLWMTQWFGHGISIADLRFYDQYVEDQYVNLMMLQ